MLINRLATISYLELSFITYTWQLLLTHGKVHKYTVVYQIVMWWSWSKFPFVEMWILTFKIRGMRMRIEAFILSVGM